MTQDAAPADTGIVRFLKQEWFLGVSLATIAIFYFDGKALFDQLPNPVGLTLIFLWLFAVVLGSCLCVVRHADGVAEVIGEPYGTLILTLSVTTIEVLSISAVMLHGENNPALVRDTLFSVVMVILGGMAGVCLLVGGWRHKEQLYNLQGANSYLGVIIPLAVMSLILPNFTMTTPGPTFSTAQQIFITLMCAGLYATFLAVQTGRHRGYFTAVHEGGDEGHPVHGGGELGRHAVLLLAYMLPIALLAEEMAHPIDYLIETLHAPQALGGVVIAIIVATPEAVGAMRAAVTNQLQLAVNIFLGSVLSTIGLTVPIMLVISQMTGHPVYLGLSSADSVLLLLTLTVSIVTFSSGRTNILQGAVHIVLFGAFVMLMFQA
ncbi:MAG: calcium:proton antiporter [Rhizomicrobium sp.]